MHCDGLAGLHVVQKRASSNTGEKQDSAVSRQLPLERLKKGAQLVHWVGVVTLQVAQPGLAFWHARLAWHCVAAAEGVGDTAGVEGVQATPGSSSQAVQIACMQYHALQPHRTVLVVTLRKVPPAQRVHSVGFALSHSVQLVMAVLQKSLL